MTEICKPELQLQGISRINEDEKEELLKQIEEEEILECIKIWAMEKAPGPDGSHVLLYYILGSNERRHQMYDTWDL